MQSTANGPGTNVFTEENLPAAAVEALVAKLAVISSNFVANGKVGNVLKSRCQIPKRGRLVAQSAYLADGRNDTNRLMAWDQRELGDEFTLMNMLMSH